MTATGTILLVDADDWLVRPLTKAGYRVTVTDNGADALSTALTLDLDLIILELVLPDIDGLLLLRQFRMATKIPIIVCSDRNTQVDRVLSLHLGADDFMTKPLQIDEVEARVETVLRRGIRTASRLAPVHGMVPDLVMDDLCVSPRRATVSVDGLALHLSPIEFRLLALLVDHRAHILSREVIAEHIWPDQAQADEDSGDSHLDHVRTALQQRTTEHLVDAHIDRLRKKFVGVLRAHWLRTVRGQGFIIEHALAV